MPSVGLRKLSIELNWLAFIQLWWLLCGVGWGYMACEECSSSLKLVFLVSLYFHPFSFTCACAHAWGVSSLPISDQKSGYLFVHIKVGGNGRRRTYWHGNVLTRCGMLNKHFIISKCQKAKNKNEVWLEARGANIKNLEESWDAKHHCHPWA